MHTEYEVFCPNLTCLCFGSCTVVPCRSVALHHKTSSPWSVGRITLRDNAGQWCFHEIKDFQRLLWFQPFNMILKGISLCCHWADLKARDLKPTAPCTTRTWFFRPVISTGQPFGTWLEMRIFSLYGLKPLRLTIFSDSRTYIPWLVLWICSRFCCANYHSRWLWVN